jgi:hypothetical protein
VSPRAATWIRAIYVGATLTDGTTGAHPTPNLEGEGGRRSGPCPFCGGEDRFRAWPEDNRPHWWCRRCNRGGDAIRFLRDDHGLSFHQARDLVEPRRSPAHTPGIAPPPVGPLLPDGNPAGPRMFDNEPGGWKRTSWSASIRGPTQEVPTKGGRTSAAAARHGEPDWERWQRRARGVIAAAERCLWS